MPVELLIFIGIVALTFLVLLMAADLLATIRYKHCPKCKYSGKEKSFDLQ